MWSLPGLFYFEQKNISNTHRIVFYLFKHQLTPFYLNYLFGKKKQKQKLAAFKC